MEEKKYVKISMGTAICLIIIFVLIIGIVGLGVYMYATNTINNKNENSVIDTDISNENSTSNTNVNTENKIANTTGNETESNTNNIQEVDINSELIKNLYNYVVKYNDYQELTVYQTKKITKDDINNQLKLITVFNNLKENEASDVKDIVDEYGAKYKHEYYSAETVENKAKEIFGQDVQINHEDFEFRITIGIDYENGMYHKQEYQGGGGTPWWAKRNIVKAEQTGDTIVIYDKYAHVYSPEDSSQSTNRGIFTASDKKKKITDNDNIDALPIDKYQNFKHTFKKDKNSNKYYWLSTEPIN